MLASIRMGFSSISLSFTLNEPVRHLCSAPSPSIDLQAYCQRLGQRVPRDGCIPYHCKWLARYRSPASIGSYVLCWSVPISYPGTVMTVPMILSTRGGRCTRGQPLPLERTWHSAGCGPEPAHGMIRDGRATGWRPLRWDRAGRRTLPDNISKA